MKNEENVHVQVSHRFSASAERVFDAWLDPEKTCRFLFATAKGQVVRTEIDARVGGGFVIVDRRAGEDVEHLGTYVEIDRPRRLTFTLRVPKYSEDTSTVSIDIVPLPDGCELTLTHEMARRWDEFRGRTQEGWQLILDVLAEILPPAEPSCGAGLAQHSSVPAKIAPLFAALAETLQLHRAMLDPGKHEAARTEDAAYRELAERFRDLAQRSAETAAVMSNCRTLAPCPHDTAAFGPKHREAFERFVKAQNQLLEILGPAAERDEKMFASMPKA